MSASNQPARLKCKHCNHQDRADNCFWYGAAFCCSLCGHPMFSLMEPAKDEPVSRCEMCERELLGPSGESLGLHPAVTPGMTPEVPQKASSVAKLLLCQQCEWERGRAVAFIEGLDD